MQACKPVFFLRNLLRNVGCKKAFVPELTETTDTLQKHLLLGLHLKRAAPFFCIINLEYRGF